MSYILKLHQAEVHLECLEQDVKRRIEMVPYSFPLDLDFPAGEGVCYLKVNVPIPETWAPMIGDILFNLRSALDHLAFSLAMKGGNGNLTDRQIRESCFPAWTVKPSGHDRRRTIGAIAPRAQVAISRLQPYREGTPQDHFLHVLTYLNNIDKHRTLHVASTSIGAMLISGGGVEVFDIEPAETAFINDGDVVARFKFDKSAGPRPENPHIRVDIYMGECFTDLPTPGRVPVDQGLRHILNWIRAKVLPPLEPFL